MMKIRINTFSLPIVLFSVYRVDQLIQICSTSLSVINQSGNMFFSVLSFFFVVCFRFWRHVLSLVMGKSFLYENFGIADQDFLTKRGQLLCSEDGDGLCSEMWSSAT